MKNVQRTSFLIMILMIIRISGYADTINWPKQISNDSLKIILYQPQPDSMVGNHLFLRAAVEVTPAGREPRFGAIWVDATLDIV